jgi:hypothetical protein
MYFNNRLNLRLCPILKLALMGHRPAPLYSVLIYESAQSGAGWKPARGMEYRVGRDMSEDFLTYYFWERSSRIPET